MAETILGDTDNTDTPRETTTTTTTTPTTTSTFKSTEDTAAGFPDSAGRASTAEHDDADSKDAFGDKEDGGGDADAFGYDAFSFPDGVHVNETHLSTFREVARELELTQEQAQKLVDLQTKMGMDAVEAQTMQWEQTCSEWRGELLADPEIGGRKFDGALRTAMLAATHYGDPELVNVLKTNPMYGNNPSLVRFLHRVGKTLTSGQAAIGGQPSSSKRDAAEVLYGSRQS